MTKNDRWNAIIAENLVIFNVIAEIEQPMFDECLMIQMTTLCLSETSPESVEHHDVYENSCALIESARNSKEKFKNWLENNGGKEREEISWRN